MFEVIGAITQYIGFVLSAVEVVVAFVQSVMVFVHPSVAIVLISGIGATLLFSLWRLILGGR